MVNKHGLSRYIPLEIKQKIRITDGFGCVICGNGIIQYEHIEPEFSEAKEHDPKCMTILCGSCHDKVSRGIWSKEKVFNAKQNPFSKKKGFSIDWFDFGDDQPYIIFGGIKLEDCQIPIKINNKPLISIKPPLENNSPFLLSATFYDKDNNLIFDILDNEWRAYISNFDVIFSGRELNIYNANKEIVLQLIVDPPNGVTVSKLDMFTEGHHFIIENNAIYIDGNKLIGGIISGCRIGLQIND